MPKIGINHQHNQHADQLLTNHAFVGRKSAFRLFSPFLLDGLQYLRIGIKNIDFG